MSKIFFSKLHKNNDLEKLHTFINIPYNFYYILY